MAVLPNGDLASRFWGCCFNDKRKKHDPHARFGELVKSHGLRFALVESGIDRIAGTTQLAPDQECLAELARLLGLSEEELMAALHAPEARLA